MAVIIDNYALIN